MFINSGISYYQDTRDDKTPLPSEGLQSFLTQCSWSQNQGGGPQEELWEEGQCSADADTDSENERPGMAPQFRGSPAVCPQASNLTLPEHHIPHLKSREN